MLQLALSSCRPMLDLCGDCCVCKALHIEVSWPLTLRFDGVVQGFGDMLSRMHKDRQRRKLLSDDFEVVCLSQEALASK